MTDQNHVHALLPGTYDPVTFGHLDVIKQASNLFDKVTVLVSPNASKNPTFTPEKRVELIEECVRSLELTNIAVRSFNGLTADFVREQKVDVIVKGVRNVFDFEYEQGQSLINRQLSGVETIFIPAKGEYSTVSSTIVREVASFGGDVSELVPRPVLAAMKELQITPPSPIGATPSLKQGGIDA